MLQHAEEFVTVSLDQFRHIMDVETKRLRGVSDNRRPHGDPSPTRRSSATKKKVVLVMAHVRSGGTFLTQCFEDVDGGVRVVSEPEIFYHFMWFTFRAIRDNVDRSETDDLLKLILLYFCRRLWTSDEGDDEVSTIVIKMPPHLPWLMKPLTRVEEALKPYFGMSFLFLYRNPLDFMKSWLR